MVKKKKKEKHTKIHTYRHIHQKQGGKGLWQDSSLIQQLGVLAKGKKRKKEKKKKTNINNSYIVGLQQQLTQRRNMELKKLDKQVHKTMKAGHKSATQQNIKSQYDNYKRFCKHFSLPKFPADSWQLCRFAQYLANQGKSPGTCANHISTVRTVQALRGYQVPDLYDISIKLTLKGFSNMSKHVKRQAEAMTPQMLMQIAKLVNYKSTFETVCFVALLTGFFLLLRKSNLVPNSMTGKTGFNPCKQFQHKDLRLGHKTILADIKWSKTLQNSGRRLQLPLLPLVA